MNLKVSTTSQTSLLDGKDVCTSERRRQFLADHFEACTELLNRMWTDLKTESPEAWQSLRFKGIGDAVTWSCEQWRSEDFNPEEVGWSRGLLPCERSTFAVAEFWELQRLAKRQQADLHRDAGSLTLQTREQGQKRPELTRSSKTGPDNLPVDERESFERDIPLSVRPEWETALTRLADKVLRTLDALVTQVHSALPVLWLEQQQKFRAALASYFGTGLYSARLEVSLPECVTEARPSARAKVSSLSLFRFAVLYAPMPLDPKRVEDAAFREIYLQNVENPPWPSKVRDRWDVVPKAIAATRMQKLKFPVGPNQVREAARDRLGSLTRDFMGHIRNLTNPDTYPETSPAILTLVLELVLARDSITKTLQDEYARSDRPWASAGPSSNVIQHWHSEIDEALEELRALLNTQEELS